MNVFGVMEVTRALLPHFRHNAAGIIINLSSSAGVFGLPMISLNTASKFALEGFSESLFYELRSLGIVIKLVEPGGIITTEFGSRSATEASQAVPLADYDDFTAATLKIFDELRGARLATSDDVANAIFDVATDGTDTLRYVATQDIEPLVKSLRETSEALYMEAMRPKFMPTVTK